MASGRSLRFIADTIPSWFAPTAVGPDAIEGHAVVPAGIGVGRTVADLRIKLDAGIVDVAETTPGTVFPADCPERHINSDGSFCVGYGAGEVILTRDDAIVWWGLVEEYLRLQRIAARTRRWPARKAIAHGKAGPHQIRAIEAACELGLEDEYYEMLDGEEKWFSCPFPRLNEAGDGLRNGRLPCPVGCLRKGQAVMRRSCGRTSWVVQLIREERLRRERERAFAEANRLLERACCGAMADCPRVGTTHAGSTSREAGPKISRRN
ncbi:E2 domain-containing protein [Methylopila sp. M107]|uniref:E2 domain-containing protein n=1 Tax=Methylopila sp. M107 TaxID=1101190 RepID=UPI00037AF8B6|nr:E2 domain-containing protein [Methylopila sp. M107]